MKIEENTIWFYVGPVPGSHMPHKTILVENDSIVTMSDPSLPGPTFSWHGTVEEFQQNFKPAELV